MALEPSERVTELIARFDERIEARGEVREACEVCGFQRWMWMQDTIVVGETEMLVFFCRWCGHVRYHVAAVLVDTHAPYEP